MWSMFYQKKHRQIDRQSRYNSSSLNVEYVLPEETQIHRQIESIQQDIFNCGVCFTRRNTDRQTDRVDTLGDICGVKTQIKQKGRQCGKQTGRGDKYRTCFTKGNTNNVDRQRKLKKDSSAGSGECEKHVFLGKHRQIDRQNGYNGQQWQRMNVSSEQVPFNTARQIERLGTLRQHAVQGVKMENIGHYTETQIEKDNQTESVRVGVFDLDHVLLHGWIDRQIDRQSSFSNRQEIGVMDG